MSGAFAALSLARAGAHVTVFDAGGGAATDAGLAHPFTARKGRPAWRFAEAMDALESAAALAGAASLLQPGVLRPARDDAQSRAFQSVAAAHPAWATWLPADESRSRFSSIAADRGSLWISRGCSVAFGPLLEAVLSAASSAGARLCPQRADAIEATRTGVRVRAGADAEFDQVLLCVGRRLTSSRC